MDEESNIESLRWIIHRLIFLVIRKIKTLFFVLIPKLLKGFILKPGLSFIIRAKNEEENIQNCIMSIVDIADEIVFVDNLSTDKTLSIVKKLGESYPKIKIFEYKVKIPKCGDEQKHQLEIKSSNTIGNYYNWCLNKATRYNIVKWDADCIANKKNLFEMVKLHNLHKRNDKFSLWFTGETVFTDEKHNYYLNKDSFYDEFRCYSKLNCFKWTDNEKWEAPLPIYIATSIHERYEKPCFYEIKNINKKELASSRTNGVPLDDRDKVDNEIMQNLKNIKLKKGSLEPISREVINRNILKTTYLGSEKKN